VGWGVSEASDGGSGLYTAQLVVAGVKQGTPVGEPYEGTYDTASVAQGGSVDAGVDLCDRVGNCTALTAGEWKVDRSVPTGVTLTLPPVGGARAGSPQLAFPTAEGFGRFASGGRGGSVCKVNKLSDDGSAGTLRYCLTQSGARTVVFTTGGRIILGSDIDGMPDDLTVACQTAPGGGIMISGDWSLRPRPGGNMIWRGCRVRLTNTVATTNPGHGGMSVGQDNENNSLIFDHMSVGWVRDDIVGTSSETNGIQLDVTWQWSVFSENFKDVAGSGGGSWIGGGGNGAAATMHVSYLHNLFANNFKRTPHFGSGTAQVTNNVVQDCNAECIYMLANYYAVQAAIVNNYMSFATSNVLTVGCGYAGFPSCVQAKVDASNIYMKGNVHTTRRPDASVGSETAMLDTLGGPYAIQSTTVPSWYPALPSQTSAVQAKADVIAKVGARWPARDAIDTKAVNHVINNTGGRCGGSGGPTIAECLQWPTYAAGTAPPDTDNDGIPNSWEVSHGAADGTSLVGSAYASNGYTNLENYLNELAGDTIPAGAGGLAGEITLTAAATDPESGIESVVFMVDGQDVGVSYQAPYTYGYDTRLVADGSHSFQARAINGAGLSVTTVAQNGAVQNGGAVADTTVPSSPPSLSATAVSSSSITASWGAASDNVGVTSYRVQNCKASVCTPDTCSPWAFRAEVPGLSYTDTGLDPNAAYCYRVWAKDAAGNVSASPSPRAGATTLSGATPAGIDAVVTLEAYPPVLIPGQSVSLNWHADYASTCTASGGWSGAKALDGPATLSPSATVTYTLTCQGSTGVAFADSVTVPVMSGQVYHIRTDGNDSNDGKSNSAGGAWKTIAKANTTLTAGQSVFIHAGTYTDEIVPQRSGSANNYISYANWPGDAVVVQPGSGRAANLDNKSYIFLMGLGLQSDATSTAATRTTNIVNMVGASRSIIAGGYVKEIGAGWRDGNAIRMDNASYNQVLRVLVESTNGGTAKCSDNNAKVCAGLFEGIKMITGSHHNLFDGNTIAKFKHYAINSANVNMTASHDNVFRRNLLRNFWHGNYSPYPAQFEIFEQNSVNLANRDYASTPWPGGNKGGRYGSGTQLGGQGQNDTTGAVIEADPTKNIVRFNTFAENGKDVWGNGLDNSWVYNNVFYQNYKQEAYYKAGQTPIEDNRFINNIVQSSRTKFCLVGSVGLDDNYIFNNILVAGVGSGGATGGPLGAGDCVTSQSLSSLQSTYPSRWKGNIQTAPAFVEAPIYDFHLANGSAGIDAGTFLTTATSTGSGSAMPVVTTVPFSDGRTVPSYKGDLIMTATGKKTARVTSISGNTLNLNKSISWTSGEGVHMIFLGAKPDMGAYER